MAIFALAAVASTETGNDAKPAKPEVKLTGPEILKKMAEAYATCKSYRDTGEVIDVSHLRILGLTIETRVSKRPFSTAFVRPNFLRFEFRSRYSETMPWHKYVVWSDGKKIRSWWTITPQVEEFKTISLALAGPTGVSGGSAHTIPRLLLPDDVKGFILTELKNPRLIGEESFDSIVTHKIEGDWGYHTTLWIDTKTYLLRQIFETDDDHTVETTTTYHPNLDVKINPSEFQFEPPKN